MRMYLLASHGISNAKQMTTVGRSLSLLIASSFCRFGGFGGQTVASGVNTDL